MTRRLTSSSLAGTLRKLVAVGTPRLRSMLATIMAPAPRMSWPASAAWPAGAAGCGAAAAAGAGGRRGAAAAAGAGARPGRSGSARAPPWRCRRVRVVGEELLPALAHRRRVGAVPLVHLLDEPRVGPELLRLLLGHGRDATAGPSPLPGRPDAVRRRRWRTLAPAMRPSPRSCRRRRRWSAPSSPSPPAAAVAGRLGRHRARPTPTSR